MKLKYTYTVVREETVTKKDLEEYGNVMNDKPMTLKKYRKYQEGFIKDEIGEYLYGGCAAVEKITVKVQGIK